MKKALFFAPVLLLAACTGVGNNDGGIADSTLLSTDMVQNASVIDGADTAVLNRMPVIHFADTAHDFGAIREGEVAEYKFSFRNTGKSPLLIAGTESTCGCTASDYPHEPVMPDQSADITVRFKSAGRVGHQEKSVTLSTNAAPVVPQLHITAEVSPNP